MHQRAKGYGDLVDMTVGTTIFYFVYLLWLRWPLLLHGGLPSCGEWGLLLP